MKKLFKGGKTVSSEGVLEQDILIQDEKIVAVGKDLPDEDAEVIDVSDKLLFPGFIDAHTHFDLEVSDTVTADDFYTGTRQAVAEGTTTIIDFATQNHGETLKEALVNWHRKADGKSSCDYGFHMAISQWNERIAQELPLMKAEGVTSFKLYMTYDAMYLNDGEIYKALKAIKEEHGVVGVHCENRDLIAALVEEAKSKGDLAPFYHEKTRPYQAEAEAINRLLEIASVVDVPVLIVHLSTKAGLGVIRGARERGQKVFVETCPQYLLMNSEKYQLTDEEAMKYIIAPPLRTEEDQRALWEAIAVADIDTVATDHCSFTTAQKEKGLQDFTNIPCGMPGVGTRPALMYTFGVGEGKISVGEMCRLLAENPAKLYGLYPRKGALLPGSDADIVVWDEEVSRTLTNQSLSACDYNPYQGTKVKGRATKVYLRGTLVAQDGGMVQENTGCYLYRQPTQMY
ncbi:dihydropyrimidinase [Lachnospiraceae bacterium PF1-22]|uniref:dihydropyrimidinase n=1 Tax=Ohessyouella blattaphilus TaxID=2949333 RepID=UPI003E2CD23D